MNKIVFDLLILKINNYLKFCKISIVQKNIYIWGCFFFFSILENIVLEKVLWPSLFA